MADATPPSSPRVGSRGTDSAPGFPGLGTERATALLRQAAESQHIGTFDWSPHEDRIEWSRGLKKLAGLEEAAPSPSQERVLERIHPDDVGAIRSAIDEALRGRAVPSVVFRFERFDGGGERVFRAHSERSHDAEGHALVRGIVVDISEERRLGAEREIALAELDEAQRIGKIGSYVWNVRTDEVTWSPGLFAIYGRDPDDGPIPPAEWPASFDRDDRLDMVDVLRRIRTGVDDRFDRRFRILPIDDSPPRHVRALGEVCRGEDGCPEIVRGVVRDETEERAAHEAARRAAHDLELAVASAEVGFFRVRPTEGRVEWNEQQSAIHGLEAGEFGGRMDDWRDLLHQDDAPGFFADILELQAGAPKHSLGFRVVRPSGEIRHVRAAAEPVTDLDGRVVEVVGTSIDVTDERERAAELRVAAAAFENALDGLAITDLDGTILRVNRAFTEITGYSRDEVVGRNPRLLKSGRHELAFYEQMFRTLAETGRWSGEIWNRNKSGVVYPEFLQISQMRDDEGRPTGFVGAFSDITRRKEAEARLEFLAWHDPLTGLPNRSLLRDRLSRALLHAERRRSRVAVAYLDLDHFKDVNDALGHPAGDDLMEQVAERLQSRVRREDTLARIGGDEFVVVVEGIADSAAAAAAIARLQTGFAMPFHVGGGEMRCTCSVGVAMYPEDGESVERLLRNADAAMYDAKERGRNAFEFYSEELTSEAFERMFLESALREAVIKHDFVLEYQPQIDIADGRLVGVEALVRWDHRQRGRISPGQFIPIAEQTDIIVELGQQVLEMACRQADGWLAAGIDFGRVGVNVSGRQIQEGDLVDRVRAILDAWELPGSRLDVEVTEGFVMGQLATAVEQLTALRELGVSVSVDDFGTGYSSLRYLKTLPIDTLKVDRSFVVGLPDDASSVAIAGAVVALGSGLELAVVAEGVETAEQADALLRMGCTRVQGFRYARPMPPEVFAEWYEARRCGRFDDISH